MPAPKRAYKDSLFRFLFNDEQRFLSFYFALIGEKPKDVLIKRVNLDDAFHMSIRNDVAFDVNGRRIILIEHQSTPSPNMPLRMVRYLMPMFNNYYDSDDVYRTLPVKLPTPTFIVVYKGSKKVPSLYCTDDLFIKTDDKLDGEYFRACTKVIDLNNEQALKDNCEELDGFSRIIDEIEFGISCGVDRDTAIQLAVEKCIAMGILSPFLRVHATEVNAMLVRQYNRATHDRIIREEGFEEGIEKGREEGIEKGIEKGREEGLEKGIEKGIEKGREEGRKDSAYKLAKTLLLRGYRMAEVAELTELSLDEVLSL